MNILMESCSGILCLGLMIFGAVQIMTCLAYYAAMHTIPMATVGLVTGVLSCLASGFCLFKLISEVAVIFRRNEDEADFVGPEETRRQRFWKFTAITFSLLVFVGLSINSFYVTKTATGVCRKKGECAPQVVAFGLAFAVVLAFAVKKIKETYPQVQQVPVPNAGYQPFHNESEA